jgi:hypothetical protein
MNWLPVSDRHQQGRTNIGPAWIRFTQSGAVDAWYTCFGETQKWCAQEGDTLELVKELIEEEYQRVLFSRQLAEKNR